MGFWGGLGKVLLKAAPIAAAFIPGVGPLASAAIGAGTSAAAKKASGGSWKDALISGGLGALPTKGIGPSGSAISKITGGIAKTVKGGQAIPSGGSPNTAGSDYIRQGINKTAGQMNKGTGEVDEKGIAGGFDWKKAAGIGAGIAGGIYAAKKARDAAKPEPYQRPGTGNMGRYGTGNYEGTMRGLGPVMGRRDQNFPNLAEAIGAGRQEAIRNQPFRKGYDITTSYYGPEPANDEEGNVGELITETRRMPKIYPTGGGGRRRQAAY